MTQALALAGDGEHQPRRETAVRSEWTPAQVELIKRTVAKGTTDDELKVFLYVAKHTGLDPLLKQVHAVKRWDRTLGREVMAIQTGIDGYRAIADRTGCYAPGKEASYEMDGDRLVSATAYVKKWAKGVWHEAAATAYFDEYCQRTKDGKPNSMWAKMPKNQLAKCAEALVLRRAFPAEFGGLYTDEEMAQANTGEAVTVEAQAEPVQKPSVARAIAVITGPVAMDAIEPPLEATVDPKEIVSEPKVTADQRIKFWKTATGVGKRTEAEIRKFLADEIKVEHTADIPARLFENAMAWAKVTK